MQRTNNNVQNSDTQAYLIALALQLSRMSNLSQKKISDIFNYLCISETSDVEAKVVKKQRI